VNKEYPDIPNFTAGFADSPDYSIDKGVLLQCYAELKHEYGSENIQEILNIIDDSISSGIEQLKNISPDEKLKQKEPDVLDKIKKLRPEGPRKMVDSIPQDKYKSKLAGALNGRFAGCTLGAPVEFWSIDKMKRLARENGIDYPPRDYWAYVPDPYQKRYRVSKREEYTKNKLNLVPVDDDITYTILGLLIAEDYGLDFSIKDVGVGWLKYLPYAETAEKIALRNLKDGVAPSESGKKDNPFCEWIGAYIRSDPWGYLAPGNPEKAAEMAYKDAFISHRRQGIYGEMFFSAVIAASFVVDNAVEAIEIGLTEIPEECALAREIKWALDLAPEINNYRTARDAVEERFKGMNPVHTINNACLTVWGLTIGERDFTDVIGQTVAMGLDNDCTAATAGSIAGALIGIEKLPDYWYNNFNDTVLTYLKGKEKFSIEDLVDRFYKQSTLIN